MRDQAADDAVDPALDGGVGVGAVAEQEQHVVRVATRPLVEQQRRATAGCPGGSGPSGPAAAAGSTASSAICRAVVSECSVELVTDRAVSTAEPSA